MPENHFEILAPAGNLATLKAAVNNGADAVYIGGRAFSARKNAVNFTNEEIMEAVAYAHLYGASVYVTVNTLVSDLETEDVYEFIKFLYDAGVDALIIQDLGILKIARECFPDFEIHASTQMTVHNLDGARLMKELGFKRVVLSRELTFGEIKNISKNVDIELEVFVHGALCMSYSGQCLMSSFLGARSGNRGACAQPCRLPCTLCSSTRKPVGGKDKYLLSLKDLCLIDEMDTLRECNVKSLKIEGRMKSTEYVSLVTSVYHKYRNGGKVSSEDYSALESIFSRSGFTKGYLEGNTGRHMLNYDKNNDDVYEDIKPHVLSRASSLAEKEPQKLSFDAEVKIALGKPMELSVTCKGKTVKAFGAVPAQKALNVSLDPERVKGQIAKTGSTPFLPGSINTQIDEGVSLPVKEINEVRRMALGELVKSLSAKERSQNVFPLSFVKKEAASSKKAFYTAEVRSIIQAKAALDTGFERVLVPYSLYKDNKEFFDTFSEKIALLLPPVLRDNREITKDIIPQRVYASNLSHFKTFKDKDITADFRINIFNSLSADFLLSLGAKEVCLSPELNLRQICALGSPLPKELIVYGRIPVMTLQNCVVKSAVGKCSCTDDVYWLKDRKNVLFPLFTDKNFCTNIIYNSTPVYMADRLSELPGDISSMRFIFTVETPEEIREIYLKYKNKEKYDESFTRGHYYRGV